MIPPSIELALQGYYIRASLAWGLVPRKAPAVTWSAASGFLGRVPAWDDTYKAEVHLYDLDGLTDLGRDRMVYASPLPGGRYRVLRCSGRPAQAVLSASPGDAIVTSLACETVSVLTGAIAYREGAERLCPHGEPVDGCSASTSCVSTGFGVVLPICSAPPRTNVAGDWSWIRVVPTTHRPTLTAYAGDKMLGEVEVYAPTRSGRVRLERVQRG